MSTGPNPILAADNTFIGVTNYAGYTGTGVDGAAQSLKAASFLPLTTSDGTATGQIVVATRALGSSAVAPQQFSTASTAAPVTANGDAFTLTSGQRGFVQNLDTEPLFVKLGTGASAASFNYVLKAGAVADDGTGGSILIDNWTGVVSIFATATARASAFKLS